MTKRRTQKNRAHDIQTKILSAILIVCVLVCLGRGVQYQLIEAQKYKNQASGIYTRKVTVKAARGEILDCYGRQIAVNRDGYNIVFNRAYIDMDNINDTIVSLMSILKSHNLNWTNTLPIAFDQNGNPSFTDDKTEKSALISLLNLADYATAQDCVEHMLHRYSLESMSKVTQQQLMGVRYSIERADFSISNPYTFAEDISTDAMTVISENNFLLKGVSVNIVPFRMYVDPSFAPHIIGKVGPIMSENWDKYKEKGYSFNDKVGQSGIEASQEDYLRGTDGEITYTLDNSGNIISEEVTKQPIPGNNVTLTLDKNLQLASQNALKTFITDLNSSGGRSTGGAIVVIDIDKGGVLTGATYPSYTYDEYAENYSALAASKNTPLLNRAFSGIYPCGSTIKPAVAIAALQEHKVTSQESIRCIGRYTRYDTYQPKCMHIHGSLSLDMAIAKSCNYYFYEMGYRLGINTLNSYLKQFGFGSKTGIELSESAGILSQPSETGAWIGGDTLRVSIGQMNAFTPLQIANYVSTLASNGTRYKTTLISSVENYDYSKTLYSLTPTVAAKINIKDNVLSDVKNAMLSVTQEGTGSSMFKNYPVNVGGKTGTAQTSKGKDHNVFIAFAPFENPEIAVAVVIEHGASSYTSGSVLKKVFDNYFFTQDDAHNSKTAYTALK